ncbi:MAG: STT3 domain-containing protein [Candidatus Nanoarchaeia archaeon]
MDEEKIIEQRQKKLVNFFKEKQAWIYVLLIVALVLGGYIRSLPMQDHSQGKIPSFSSFVFSPSKNFGGTPGLRDITTNTWTLGPDLDPFLFLRNAREIVEHGYLPTMDYMRNYPVGFDTSVETKLLPYMIVYTYKFLSYFSSDVTVDYAGVVFPVISFLFTIIIFFFFVKELFSFESQEKNKANIIAIVATFFMIVIPVFLSRTVAGIPEKESAAFFFMFLSFWTFLRAWKTKNTSHAVVYSLFTGIATALMGLVWGGVVYILVTIAVAGFIAFILNRVDFRQFIAYSVWLISSIIMLLLTTNKFSLADFFSSVDSALATMVFMILLVHFAIWKTGLSKLKVISKIKLSKTMTSLVIALGLVVVISSIAFGPGFIIEKISSINQMMFKPVTGRWSVTVAENKQPYFVEWVGSFGPMYKNIPIIFWLFFIGSALLFNYMLKDLRKRDSAFLTMLYILFFFGMVFSRYSAQSIFNGENFLSKIFYYGSVLLLAGYLIYYENKYKKEGKEGFENINFELIFLFALLALTLFTARSAVRLIMVLGPIAPIFSSYLTVDVVYKFFRTKDQTNKVIFGVAALIIVIISLFAFYNFYNQIKAEAYSFVPSIYTNQWQKAMQWVRNETPTDAVFAHWWDYGYWLQSIGNRATVTDGGNFIVYWNYLSGRLVLTGDNQKDSLEFLYSHNATHLLIDSTDIGKYTAFSSIGSDKSGWDRFAWIPTLESDSSQTQETRNGTIRVYQGGSAIDGDIVYENNGTKINLPGQKAAIIGIIVQTTKTNTSEMFNQPKAVYYYQGRQIEIPLRYVYFNNRFVDFGSGLEACIYIIQKVYSNSQGGLSIDNTGSIIYISPKVLKGYLAQKYLLNDPFKKFPNFELVHSEPAIYIESLNSQGANLGEFTMIQGSLQGPIKIWEINYTGNETYNPEYVRTTIPDYIDWEF